MRHLRRLGVIALYGTLMATLGASSCESTFGDSLQIFGAKKKPRGKAVGQTTPPAPEPTPEPTPEPSPTPPPPSGGGWTTLTPSVDTRFVYVSSSAGNDSNDGLSEASPKASLAAGIALLRDGMPDWLQLKAGDTWTGQDLGSWSRSGRSSSEPMVVTSYGSGARPRIRTGSDTALFMGQLHQLAHIYFVGLHLEAHTSTGDCGAGVLCLAVCDDILFEDCLVEKYKDNFVVQAADGPDGSITNIRLRRCVIVDSFSNTSHSQGIFAAGIDGLLIEQCLFDANGSNPAINGAEETIFNHNMYIQSNCWNVVIRENISARASSHGLQLRPGGVAQNNLFLRNAISMFAAGEGSGPQTRVTQNVVLDGKDINGEDRGSGIEIFDSQNALVDYNIVAHKPPGVGAQSAFKLMGCVDDDPNAPYVVTFENNIAYQWNGSCLETEPTYTALTVRDNILQDLSNGNYTVNMWSFLGFEVFENNQYWSNRLSSTWFRIEGTQYGLSGWNSVTGETGAQATQVSFPAPSRTIATYMSSLGGTPSLSAFLAEARLQSKAYWRDAYSAPVANTYFRAGFGR